MKALKSILTGAILCAMPAAALAAAPEEKVVVAYVTSWTDVMPDPAVVTHINYAFGHVTDTFDGVRVDNPERLHAIAALKKTDPELKVMLSVGGWGSGRFSEMAADAKNRESFAKDCARVAREFDLDGIDIDWEYPTSDAAGISADASDTENFTLLMRDLREAIGADKLLTCATVASGQYIDFKGIIPFVDFVNIMTYDMADAPKHHAALYRSENTPEMACHECVQAHIAAGVPAGKLVLGMPFYGRGGKEMRGRNFGKMNDLPEGYTKRVDAKACVPYVANAAGELVMGYDDAASIAAKCRYVLDNDLLGVMYWDYSGDDETGTLSRTAANLVKHQPNKRKVLVLNEGGGQHGPFTAKAMEWLRKYAAQKGFAITELRNADPVTAEFLNDYAAVVQLDFPPYTWPEAAEKAFESYIDEGKGGWVGFHHATLLGEFDGYGLWKWFADFMGGITFRNYIAPLADGTVRVEKAAHPVMDGVPAEFVLPDDEWYVYDRNPRPNVEVLANVDEASYHPASDVKMGDHPVVWTNPAKKARNVYIQPGHSPRLFESEAFVRMFGNALDWAIGE